MIKHEIIVHKPVVNQFNYHTASQTAYPEIKSQEDLDKWLLETKFSVGDYVTFHQQELTSVSMPHAVYTIAEMRTEFGKLENTRYSPYHPLLVKIRTMPSLVVNTPPHSRWDDMRNLRKVSPAEIHQVIIPYLDRIRDNSKSS